MRHTKESSRFTIETKFQGKTYSANYSVVSNTVEVASIHGSRSIPVGRSKPETTAQWLHREILEEAKSRGEISTILAESDLLHSRSDFIPATRKEASRSLHRGKHTTRTNRNSRSKS